MHQPPDEPTSAPDHRQSQESAEEAARYAEAVVRTVRHPLLVLNGNLTVETANPAFYRCFQVDPEETRGRRLYDLGNGQWDIPALHRLLEEVLREEDSVEDYRVEHEFEAIGKRVMLLNANRMERGAGRDYRILLAITDITERERERWELEAQNEYLEKIFDAVRNPILVLDWDLRVKSANQRFYDTFRTDPDETEGRLVYELGSGQWDIPQLKDLLENVLPENNTFDDFEVEHDFPELGYRVMLLNARKIDHKQWILLAINDVSERRRMESQQRAAVGESQHRIKNILMNVSALARQTLQSSATLEDFSNAFQSRLDALGRTQDMLMRGEDRATLDEIVCLELEALGAKEGRQFTLEGPAVPLSARGAQAVAMTVHELATNAAKYGALATADARIEIAWRKEAGEGGERVSFRWRERGVPIDAEAVGRGFGTQLIESSVRFGLGGTSQLTFHPDGVECALDFQLQEG